MREVTKTYRVGVGKARIREALPWPVDAAVRKTFPRWWSRDTFDALQDVSVSIAAGTALGIVGHNGAGKTTLLKVIAGVTMPTAGSVKVTGKIASLIDLLVGGNPDLTGRENAYLLGAMHGFGRKEMASLVDQVLEFAGLQEMADTPFKRYSSGMAARLGFATITALDVDILLVDEVLSVGDAAFQGKCIRWLDEYRSRGGTLVFVSHNMGLIRNMTDRVIWLDHGELVAEGPAAGVVNDYSRATERREGATPHRTRSTRRQMAARGLDRWGAGGARVEEVRLEEIEGDHAGLRVSISYEASALEEALFCVGFVDEGGRDVGAAVSSTLAIGGESGSVGCTLSPVPLRPGVYFPVVAIISTDGLVRDRWKLDRAVVIEENGRGTPVSDFGPVELDGTWSVSGDARSRPSPHGTDDAASTV
ncbi:MAG: ABC transporter ATP-binding protein [Actinomycetota bacterium]